MFDLTGFQRDLLVTIRQCGDRPSGQTIRRRLENHIDNVNHGRLYPNLDSLIQEGLVEKGREDGRTNYYAITDDGHEALGEWLGWATTEA